MRTFRVTHLRKQETRTVTAASAHDACIRVGWWRGHCTVAEVDEHGQPKMLRLAREWRN